MIPNDDSIDYVSVMARAQNIAMHAAARRLRDDHGLSKEEATDATKAVIDTVRDLGCSEIDRLAGDMVRIERAGKGADDLADAVIAAFAVVGVRAADRVVARRACERN